MHPRGLRCSSFKYSRYSQSSRLARGAPRPSRCDARLSPWTVNVPEPSPARNDSAMAARRPDPATHTSRRPARDLIDAVVHNMQKNLEQLKYSTLAPSRYIVYLHPSEYARLEGIIPILQEQTVRALADELLRLNRRSSMR